MEKVLFILGASVILVFGPQHLGNMAQAEATTESAPVVVNVDMENGHD